MMDTVASPLFDPEIESMLCTGLTTVALAFALLIIFFAFLAVRIDEIVLWSWGVVWIPLWIINALLGYAVILHFVGSIKNKNTTDEHDEDEEHDDEATKKAKRRARLARRFLHVVYYILALLFQIFIVVRLDNRVSWSAAVVFIPYFVLEGIHFVALVLEFIVGLQMARNVPDAQLKPSLVLAAMYSTFWFLAVRIVQFVLIAVRIDNIITCSWGIVFIPTYLIALKYAVDLLWGYIKIRELRSQPEAAHQAKVVIMLGIIAFVVVGALLYSLVGLIARRLDGIHYIKMATVFVPLFITLVSYSRKITTMINA